MPELLRAAKAAGVATIEVGIPHSDPISDGPALQSAAQRAIARGVTAESVLRELAAIELEGRTAVDKAIEALDQMLSPKQRARFRMLEDNIEKKKIDFLTKVRQPGGRGGH